MNISATELPNFIRKYYLLHELLIFKYWRQNILVSNIALHTAVRHSKDMVLSDLFVSFPANRGHCQAWVTCWRRLTQTALSKGGLAVGGSERSEQLKTFHLLKSLCETKKVNQELAIQFARLHAKQKSQSHRSGSGEHVFQLAFEHTVVNTDFRCADVCHSHGRTLDSQSRQCL